MAAAKLWGVLAEMGEEIVAEILWAAVADMLEKVVAETI